MKKDSSNYCISVMGSMNRIENIILSYISEEQTGFIAGKSCLDNTFTLQNHGKEKYERSRNTFHIYRLGKYL